MVDAVDPDHQAAAVAAAGPARVVEELLERAVEPLAANPELRARILEIRRSRDIVIDESSRDELLDASGVVDTARARVVMTSWRQFMEVHKDEIAALHVLYSQPAGRVSYADDLIRLIRYELRRDELVPYLSVVEDRFANWLARQRQAGVEFTVDQMWWLERIRDVVVEGTGVHAEDLD
jgi:type I restriction enzyme R subunit